ncbi:MAG: hypothetical protein ACOX5W_13565 [Bacillota bacterium]|jgi:hypothetical protein
MLGKKMRRCLTSLLVISSLVLWAPLALALAETIESSAKYVYHNNKTYAGVSKLTGYYQTEVSAQTWAGVSGGQTTPVSTLRAKARLYDGIDALYRESGWVTNTETTQVMARTTLVPNPYGSWRSQGQFGVYTASNNFWNDYNCYTTDWWPYAPSAKSGNVQEESQKQPYKVNKNGQTYGSGLDAISPDDEPDLILAMGVDGVTVGYVYSKDLDGEDPTSEKECLEMTKKSLAGFTIPLYDVDGETVIGEFQVGGSDGKIQ